MIVDIFFDLDGSLIDGSYRPNVDVSDFRSQLALLGPEAKVHLNSNRSLPQLRSFYDDFGFNGYIVLENGCSYFDPNSGMESKSCASPFNRTELQRSVEFPVMFTSTDAVAHGQAANTTDGTFIFAESSRNYTMTLYPRQVRDSRPIKDAKLLQRCYVHLRSVFTNYEVTCDPITYWNILLKPKGVLKSTLLPQLSRSERIASFGDSKDDVCMFECSMFCGAPLNASDDAKESVLARSGIVSASSYTKGAIEFLQAVKAFFL